MDEHLHCVDYKPAQPWSSLFGGNSNWRGPVWFPLNFLLIESLQEFNLNLGNDFKVEYPTDSGQGMTLWDVAMELSLGLMQIFFWDSSGRWPVFDASEKLHTDPVARPHSFL